ncbi:MAG: hypothetical protein ACYDHZ_00500 [Dehalococcoidia bacterium]
MKNLMILVLAIGLMLAGCCPRTNDSTGVTTKSFTNCLATAQTMVCNPSPAVMAVINAAAPFLAQELNILVPGSKDYVTAENAQAVILSIQAVGCTSVTSLNTLIAYLQSVLATQHAKGVYRVIQPPFDVQPLVDWSKGVK